MTNPYDCVKFISSDGNTLTIDANCPVCNAVLELRQPNVGIHELDIEFRDEELSINYLGLDLICPNGHLMEE
tara:strand:- start:781 stop:996 length:216 start_codon:yes stop_codon:yes gene_type:complete